MVSAHRLGWRRYERWCGPLIALTSLLHALLLVAPLSAAGITDYLGRPIVELRVERGDADLPEPALRDFIVTRVGTPLSMEDVRESILHLFSLGQFRDIQVDATGRADGVALRYTLVPVQVVEQVEFRGEVGLSRRRLRELIRDRYGESPPLERLFDAPRLLETLYRDNGYMNARVEVATRADRSDGATTVVFEVDAGMRAKIATLELDGTPLRTPAEVFKRLDLRVGMAYDRAAIERRLVEYADALRDQGYYEAQLDHAIDVRPRGRVIDLTVRVDPGLEVSVEFEGDQLPSQVRDDLVPIAREGSVDEDLLEDSSRRIAAYLRAQGFWNAAADYTRTEGDNSLRIVFRINRGQLYQVAGLEVANDEALPLATLRSLLSLRPGSPFVESTFESDVAAIAEEYRKAGYARVNLTSEVVEGPPSAGDGVPRTALVTPRIVIDEGPQVLIGSIVLEGAPADEDAALQALLGSVAGQPYVRSQALADRDALLQRLLDRGYEAASVQVDATFSGDGAQAGLIFVIDPGPQIFVEHVLIAGQTNISAATIRRELTLEPGQPLGRERLAESQRRLSALRLFRRIRITELRHGGDNRRDILVTVEEVASTTLGYGGGFEAGTRLRRGSGEGGQAVEQVEFAPRGFFEIGRRNLWGKNRSIDLFTRVSLRPRNDPNIEDEGSKFGFNEFRVLGTYREPRVFGWTAELLVTAFLDQSIRSSFNLRQRGVHAELRRALGPTISVSGGYTFDRNKLFDERFDPADEPLIDRLFPQIALSAFSGAAIRDSRDDPFEPTRGKLVSIDTEVAARRIGSQVGYAKTLLQGFLYTRVAGARNVIFATGVRIGVATGFPRQVVQTLGDGSVLLGSDGEPLQTTVRDLPASERFFAGGDTTVRGFALDRLGDASTIDQNGFPHGGSGLIILNTELRVPIWGSIGAAAFLDAGNVFQTVSDMSLGRLRGGAGFGVRYHSPIGPIRVDLGFKLHRLEFGDGVKEGRTAVHVSIGQAF